MNGGQASNADVSKHGAVSRVTEADSISCGLLDRWLGAVNNPRQLPAKQTALLAAAEWLWSNRKKNLWWGPDVLTEQNKDPSAPMMTAVEARSVFKILEEKNLIFAAVQDGRPIYHLHEAKVQAWEKFISELRAELTNTPQTKPDAASDSATEAAPDITEPWKFAWHHISRNWHNLKAAKFAVICIAVVSFLGGYWYTWNMVVASKQASIETLQISLNEKQSKIDELKQTLSEQQGKVSFGTNVYFPLEDLYANMTFETIRCLDTNRVLVRSKSNGTHEAFCKLRYVPISGSLQASIVGDLFPIPLENPVAHSKNVFVACLGPGWELTNVSFSVQYVRDSRTTNSMPKVEFKNQDVFVDGKRLESDCDKP
ncbi:MAG: hypothetical protein HOP33_12025 [Verrucomicrobia bacterium]|nr:hypothetical protein [Verrucomicrobiota bacterium]